MKVFITGGMGYIGAHIVLELLKRGDEVTVLARDPHKVPGFLAKPGVSMIQADLEDFGAARSWLAGHDACIHNALIWDEVPTELQMKDTRTSVNVFEAASEAGVRSVIYTSSVGVMRPFKPTMDEESRLTPTDYYGATKAASEAFLSAFSYQTDVRCNVIRPGPAIGKPAIEGGSFRSDRRLREIVQAALRGEDIHVAKHDGRQFIGADDLAQVYSAVLHSEANREIYIAVARNFTLWEQIARDAVALAGSHSRIYVEESEQAVCLFDTRKLERDFGFAFDSTGAMRDHLTFLIGRGV